MGPVCTIMVGRLDDWLRTVAARDGSSVDPELLDWAGVAVFKRAYRIFQDRGFRTRLLSAAFRNHMHWSELVGGDVVISPPFEWQVRLNSSGIEPHPRIDEPVDAEIVSALYEGFADFRARLRPGRHDAGRVRGLRRDAAHAPAVPRRVRGASRVWCATSCCPTRRAPRHVAAPRGTAVRLSRPSAARA